MHHFRSEFRALTPLGDAFDHNTSFFAPVDKIEKHNDKYL